MKKLSILLISLLLISLVSAVAIPKSIKINSCQELNKKNTNYILTKDIQTDKTCFKITSNGINLNLNNHKISGDNSGTDYAVEIIGMSNTVTNGLIEGFSGVNSAGISLKSMYNTINNIKIKDSSIGIILETSNNNIIKNVELIDIYKNGGQSAGIILSDSDNNKLNNIKTSLTKNYFHETPVAMIIQGGRKNIINTFEMNGEDYLLGIWFSESYTHRVSKDNTLNKINFTGTLMPLNLETGVIFFDATSSFNTIIKNSDLRTNGNSVSMFHGVHNAKMVNSLYSENYINQPSSLNIKEVSI